MSSPPQGERPGTGVYHRRFTLTRTLSLKEEGTCCGSASTVKDPVITLHHASPVGTIPDVSIISTTVFSGALVL